jgi:hypothetical protein
MADLRRHNMKWHGRGDFVLCVRTSLRGVHVRHRLLDRQCVRSGGGYVARGLSQPVHTDAALTAGAVIKAVHVDELRAAVMAVE